MAMTSLSALRNESAVPGVRSRFPALRELGFDGGDASRDRGGAGDRGGTGEIYFDNGAGAQVPDEVFDETRGLLAAFLNAPSTDEIIFGLNATNLTRTVADALRPTLHMGDRIIVTELDHEANIEPWLRLQANGADVVFWNLRPSEAGLDLDDLRVLLEAPGGGPVRWIAIPLASNATGGIVDVAAVAKLAHKAGA